MPDIENMQVVGFSKGLNSKEAFENLKIKSSYLLETTFNEIISIELKDKKFEYFAAEQLLKDENLDEDEINSGLIGDSNDNGIDGLTLPRFSRHEERVIQ